MRMRAPALVGGWLAALALATAVGWAGVSLVGDEVAPSGSTPLSQAEVERRIHAASGSVTGSVPPSASSAASSPASSPGSSPAAASSGAVGTSSAPVPDATTVSRSVVVEGGTVVLGCLGDRISAKTSPRAGYTVRQELNAAGTEVEITFDDGSHRSQVEGSCRAGTPTATEHETDGGEDD